MYFSISEFVKKIPKENKSNKSDILNSMLFMSVRNYFENNKEDCSFILQNIFFMANIKDPIEWEVLERALFFSLYLKKISCKGEDYNIYIRQYRLKIFLYYKIGEKGFMNFYNNLPYRDIRRIVKKNIYRRWYDREWLNDFESLAEEAVGKADFSSAWSETINAYFEAIYLYYVSKTVSIEEIKKIEKKAMDIFNESKDKIKLSPFEVFPV